MILRGFVPHDQLLDELRSGRYDMVVLPSIITAKDEQEGIPVALMEALAAGVPAVATRTRAGSPSCSTATPACSWGSAIPLRSPLPSSA